MIARLSKLSAAFALVGLTSSYGAPTIRRLESVNFSSLVAPVTAPYVAPGKTKDYTVFGAWLDHADKVTFGGVSQSFGDGKSLPFNVDGSSLRVTLKGGSLPEGPAALVIHVNCTWAPLTDCAAGNVVRPGNVIRVGTLTNISPNMDVPPNTTREFLITGTKLNVATIMTFRTSLKSPVVLSSDATQMHIRGTTSSCGTDRVVIRDRVEGGDFYPYSPGGLDIRLSTPCGYRPPPSSPISHYCPPGQTWNTNTQSCQSEETPGEEE